MPTVEPPRLLWPLVMAAVLLVSSVTVTMAERRASTADGHGAATALAATIILGIIFLGLQASEYRERLTHLTPQSNAYGSIFYTITSFHVAHLLLGWFMLAYVMLLPRVGRTVRPPHRAYSDAALYWHFVDVVWVFIVVLLYILPNIR